MGKAHIKNVISQIIREMQVKLQGECIGQKAHPQKHLQTILTGEDVWRKDPSLLVGTQTGTTTDVLCAALSPVLIL